MEVTEEVKNYYSTHNEDGRLVSRHGSVEFLTTVRYIEKYLAPGMRILEVGAGTGRYSHYFARGGYVVDAVEPVEHNIEVFNANTEPGETITVTRGNILDLSAFGPEQYDITLVLGPMYHLYCDVDKKKALAEALRVTKPGGLVYVAYCMNEATIINFGFIKGNIMNELYKTLIDPVTFKCASEPKEIFELWRREEIDALTAGFGVSRLHFVGTDMYTNYFRDFIDGMSDEVFEVYLRYHFVICERGDMTGMSHHTLDVLRKES